MALFSFLRPKVEEITKDELDSFLAIYLARLRLDEDFSEYLSEMKEKKDEALRALASLEIATLHNPDILPRAKHILDGNRAHYVQKNRLFLSLLVLPNGFLDVPSFHDRLASSLSHLARDTAKAHLVLGEFLRDERDAIERSIREIDDRTASFSRKLGRRKVGIVKKIRDLVQRIENEKKEAEKYRSELGVLEREHEELLGRKDRIEAKVAELRSSARFNETHEEESRYAKAKDDLKAEERELENAFSDLRRPLRRTFRAKDEERIALLWADDPRSGIEADPSFSILALLPKLQETDEKKRQRMQSAASTVTKEFLEAKREAIGRLKQACDQLAQMIKNNTFILQLSEQEGYLRTLEIELTHYDERVKALKAKVDHMDERRIYREINSHLMELNAKIVDE